MLERASCGVVGFLMAVLALNVLMQVLFRQVARIPVTWTDEVARFSFLWMAMVAASVQVKRKAHFAVTIITDKIANKRWLNIATYAFMLFCAAMLFFYGIRYTVLGLDKLAGALPIRMVWIYAAIPTGSLMMMVYLVELLLEELGVLKPRTENEV